MISWEGAKVAFITTSWHKNISILTQ